MQWNNIQDEKELSTIIELSKEHPVLIFKHSTRCSISSTALSRLERSWNNEEIEGAKPYFLDLLSYRNISDKIVDVFKVRHESPQALVIKGGNCIYHASHLSINYLELLKQFKS